MTTYQREIFLATEDGWTIISETESGALVQAPKKMRLQTKIGFLIGFLLVFAWGFGLIILLAAWIDHAMHKPKTRFIAKTG
jgi:hypothetical protein